MSPRDVTPDATEKVIERGLPGFGELMRRKCLEKTPTAIISNFNGKLWWDIDLMVLAPYC